MVYVSVNIFQSCLDLLLSSWFEPVLSRGHFIMVFTVWDNSEKFCLFWWFMSQSTIFQPCWDIFLSSWFEPVLSRTFHHGFHCLRQLTNVLLVFMIYVPINNFSAMLGHFPVFLVWTSTKQDISSWFSLFETTHKRFACFYDLCPHQQFFSHAGTFSRLLGLNQYYISRGYSVLLKDTTRCLWWVSNYQTFITKTNILPTSHCHTDNQ